MISITWKFWDLCLLLWREVNVRTDPMASLVPWSFMRRKRKEVMFLAVGVVSVAVKAGRE